MDHEDQEALTPGSPSFPPLASASLFPPPPPNHIHFTPLNLHFHSVLNEHWPSTRGEQDHLFDDHRGDDHEVDQKSHSTASSSLTSNPRLTLQRRILLAHASTLASIPSHIPALASPPLVDDDSVRRAIDQLTLQGIDLKLEIDPPDLTVVLEEMKGYNLFGQWWPVPARETGLEEAGVKRLYSDEDCIDEQGRIDRRPSLLLLLRSFLTSYLKLLSLLQFPPSYYALQTFHSNLTNQDPQQQQQSNEDQSTIEWQTTASQTWSHIRIIVLNIQEILNRSRGEQARCNLEGLLRRQVLKRREESRRLKDVCQGIREKIATLQNQSRSHDHSPDQKKSVIKVEQGREGDQSRPDHPSTAAIESEESNSSVSKRANKSEEMQLD